MNPKDNSTSLSVTSAAKTLGCARKMPDYTPLSANSQGGCSPSKDWPTWPFTRLTPAQMSRLVKRIKAQEIANAPDAPY